MVTQENLTEQAIEQLQQELEEAKIIKEFVLSEEGKVALGLFDKAMNTINGLRTRIKNPELAQQEAAFDWELQGRLKGVALMKSLFLGKPDEVKALEKQIRELENPKPKIERNYSLINLSKTR